MSEIPEGAPSPSSLQRLPALPAGWQAVRHVILEDGRLAAIATDVDLAGERQRIWAAFRQGASPDPPSRLAVLGATGSARIWVAAASGWENGPTFPLETSFPLFDRFSDGRWLVVATRSFGEANARVLSPKGLLVDRFALGDGIEHLAIDPADRIWVGWFDEGVFGNDDWRVPGHEWPPSRSGLACFTSGGAPMPLFEWPTDATTIGDCYALNVTGAGAWACPYTHFPLVRFLAGEPARWWRSNLAGPQAIAIAGAHALIGGGYREEASRMALVALDGEGRGEAVRLLADWKLPLRRLPDSAQESMPIYEPPALLAGRGDALHLVHDDNWYCWRVEDLLARME
jgi:hypothetical protein